MTFNLPDNFNIQLPDIQQFADSSVGFEPNPSLPRVSDAQREQDAQAFREQMNAAENLKDSIGVANRYVSAAVEATVLGQNLVKYKTGLEKIRNEGVKHQKAVTQTAISMSELTQLQAKLGFETSKLPILEMGYQAKLQTLTIQAESAQREAAQTRIELDSRYPTIDVQGIQQAA